MMKKIKLLFTKHGYITYPFICLVTIILLHRGGFILNDQYNVDTILQLVGAFLGFLIISAGIFIVMPDECRFVQFIARYPHHIKVIKRAFAVGMFSMVAVILFGILGIAPTLTLYGFFIGLAAMGVIMFYLYQSLCMKFRQIKKRHIV